MSLSASETDAKPAFGLELRTVGANPLVDHVQSKVLLRRQEVTADGAQRDIPYIGDVANEAGQGWSLTFTFQGLEVGYRTLRLPYGESRLFYRGDAEATVATFERVNDAGVNYRRIKSTVLQEALLPSTGLDISFLGGAYRYYMIDSGLGFFDLYAPIGGGVVWTQLTQVSGLNLGLYAQTGLSADAELFDMVALTLSGTIYAGLTETNLSPTEAATNSKVTDEGIGNALTSQLAGWSIELGLRLNVLEFLELF